MNQDDINSEKDYRSYELGKVKGDHIRLKIESSDGDTRWLPITDTDLDAVTFALLTFDREN